LSRKVWLMLVLGAAAAWGQDTGGYTGPAVLSWAGAPLGKYLGQPISFRFYAGVTANYYTDLFAPATDEAGNFKTGSGGGLNGTAGVYGARHGRHDTLAFDFLAGYRAHVRSQQSFNGADARVGLHYARQASLRTSFALGVNASTYSYSYGGLYQPVVTDPLEELDGPANEPFDTRTSRLSARAGVNHLLSQRWYVSFSGNAFTTQRRSAALLDNAGFSGSVGLYHRFSENTSIGPVYRYSQFYFSADMGQSWIHALQLSVQHRFSPRWRAAVAAGVYRARSERVKTVPLDPFIAAIIGRPTTLQPATAQTWGPSIQATLARTYQRGSLSFYGFHGMRPGNALMATSETTNVGVHYSYTATSRVNLGFRASYHRARAALTKQVQYDNYGGGMGIGVRLGYSLHLTAGIDYRFQDLQNSNYDRNRMQAFVGLVFSPGEIPVSLF